MSTVNGGVETIRQEYYGGGGNGESNTEEKQTEEKGGDSKDSDTTTNTNTTTNNSTTTTILSDSLPATHATIDVLTQLKRKATQVPSQLATLSTSTLDEYFFLENNDSFLLKTMIHLIEYK